jgi:hypothetical protein
MLSLLQNMAVAKAVAQAYQNRFDVEGYPNIKRMSFVDPAGDTCKARDAMSASK